MYLTDQKDIPQKGKTGAPNMELYQKSKKLREKPVDAFESDLSLKSIFSKMALVSLFLFFVSLGAYDMKQVTLAAFAGFVLFGIFYGFIRFKRA